MKAIAKIIYWAGITAIVAFLIIFPLLRILTPLEFEQARLEDLYERIRLFGLPTAILLTLFGTLKRNDTSEHNDKIAAVTVVICGICFCFLLLTTQGNMCGWTVRQTLFVNTKDHSQKIILREYGCGAWDSDVPAKQICKTQPIRFGLILVNAVDTTEIDRRVWQRVDEYHRYQ